jgi:hypothetical protein
MPFNIEAHPARASSFGDDMSKTIITHPLEGRSDIRELAARYAARANGAALSAFRAGIEAATGSLPSYLTRAYKPRDKSADAARYKAAHATDAKDPRRI